MGKTTTICFAYEELAREFPCVTLGRPARKEVKGAVLDIDGVKVGFASSGDNPHILEENLEPLIALGCVIIICATHTPRSKTVDVVQRLAEEHGFGIVWIEKHDDEGDHAGGNRHKAREIIAELHKAVERARLVEIA